MVARWKAKDIDIFIRGRGHTLTPTLLNEILEILDKGECITPTWGTISVEGYKLGKWVMKLTGGKNPFNVA